MIIRTNIHRAKSLSITEISFLQTTQTFYRDIIIHDGEGNSFNITLYGDRPQEISFPEKQLPPEVPIKQEPDESAPGYWELDTAEIMKQTPNRAVEGEDAV